MREALGGNFASSREISRFIPATLRFMTYRLAALTLLATICTAVTSNAAFIDLRGRPDLGPGSSTITFDGISLTLQSSSGNLVSSATRFGVDGTGPNDAPDLLDGGNGVNESLSFLFRNNVYLDSIVISEFDASDAGTVNLKGVGTFDLKDGINDFGGIRLSASSANFITSTGQSRNGSVLGFSIDGFNVRLVPEPSSAGLLLLGMTVLGRRRRQR